MASYDPNVDYQAKINDAVAKGDMAAAAKYEQQRNAKIDGTGASYGKTSNYSQYLSAGGSTTGGSSGSRTTSSSSGASSEDALRAQMEANSQAWHGASPEEQARLHAENERLASQLGGMRYDDASGTWGSAGNDRTVPEGFTGSTTIQNKPNQSAQDIIDKMNANSVAWHTADDATRAQLHAENEYLSSVLAGLGVTDVRYDEASGRWTGAALTEDSLLPGYTPPQLPSATHQGDSINSYYDAAQKAQLAALEAAYKQSIIDTDAAAAKIPGVYQSAMNQAAGQDAISRQNFNEVAAGSGLNSGARGQAALAQNIAYQQELSGMETAKANALAEVETQRLKIQTAYQDEIAQAVANNELARAEALYQEAVRVDESIVQTALNQAGEQYKAWASQYQTQSDYLNRQLDTEDRDYQRLFANAQTLAQFGDFSGYRALGFTDEQINRMYAVWAAENPYIAAALGGSSSGGYSSSGGSGGSAGRSGGSSTGGTGGNSAAVSSGTGSGNIASVPTSSGYSTVLRQAKEMQGSGKPTGYIARFISGRISNGAITEAEAASILNSLGI